MWYLPLITDQRSALCRRIAPITALLCAPGMAQPIALPWWEQALAPAIGLRLFALVALPDTDLLLCDLAAPVLAIMAQHREAACTVVATVDRARADILHHEACPSPGRLFCIFWAYCCETSPKSEFYHPS